MEIERGLIVRQHHGLTLSRQTEGRRIADHEGAAADGDVAGEGVIRVTDCKGARGGPREGQQTGTRELTRVVELDDRGPTDINGATG